MGVRKDLFEEIAACRKDLLAFGTRLTRNRDAAEDLVQEAMLRALEGSSGFEPGSNLRAWTRRIVLNCFLNRRARDAVRRRLLDRADLTELSSSWTGGSARGPDGIEQAILIGQLERASSGVPDAYAEAVRLVDARGYRYAEAAEALGCPIGTVMSRLHRGRRLMAEALEAA